MIGKKYQKGPVRRSSSVVRRWKVSVTRAYSRKSGTSRDMANSHGRRSATKSSTATGSQSAYQRRRQARYGTITMRGKANPIGPLVNTPSARPIHPTAVHDAACSWPAASVAPGGGSEAR